MQGQVLHQVLLLQTLFVSEQPVTYQHWEPPRACAGASPLQAKGFSSSTSRTCLIPSLIRHIRQLTLGDLMLSRP